MGTIFVVVRSNLMVAYFEGRMFANCFRFLDDVFHKCLIQFSFQGFYKIMNELYPDL